jgi:hypothetical protein
MITTITLYEAIIYMMSLLIAVFLVLLIGRRK